MAKQEKTQNLESIISHINKVHGKNTVVKLGSQDVVDVPVISTNSLALDHALGIGGYPRGRIVEIFGGESVGKSSLALHAIANVQKGGEKAAIIDVENAFDREYASKLRVDVDELYLSQPDHGEQALEIADHLIRSGEFGIVVIDSVAALVPKAELEGEMGDSKMGLHARLMSQATRKMSSNIRKTNTCCMFINQTREKIGVMFGSPIVTTGGNALKFYSSVRLDLRRAGQIKTSNDESIGHVVRAHIVKNKFAAPFKKVDIDFLYGEGISEVAEILNLGTEYGIIKKSGSWYSYDGTKIGQGAGNARDTLRDNPELLEELKGKIKQQLK